MQARERLGQLFIIPRQAAQPGCSAMTPLDHPPAGQLHNAFVCLGQLDHFQTPMLGLGVLGGVLPRIPLVDKHYFDRVSRHLLHFGGHRRDLASVVLVGRRDVERQQSAQGIHGDMDLRAPTAFRAVIPGSGATCGCRLQRAAIADRGRGFQCAALGQSQHRAQILHDGVKDAHLEPTLALRVHRMPGRQVVRHHPPRCACPDNPAQAMKDLTQAVRPLGRIFGHKG